MLPAERIGIDGAGYPDRLGSIPSPPKALWVRGSLPPVTAVAIVGTRHPTPSGCDLAEFAARSAVRAGFGVVSGLAAGIDTVAHKSALAAGGRTWAVLGSGVDLPTPAANVVLAEEIISAGGGLISELPLGTPVSPHGLVARDRIQSGLSLAVVVCQCEISSGAMQTARFAAVQGRLLLVARPNVSELEHPSWRGNLALSDPDGCDPSLSGATGTAAALVRARRPMADIVLELPEELEAFWPGLQLS